MSKYGEGVHHFSFGELDDHDEVVSALQGQGIGIELQGAWNDAPSSTLFATQYYLGSLISVDKPVSSGADNAPRPWGTYAPKEPGVVNVAKKEIFQIGIIVDDMEKTAEHYWKTFGIGPWYFLDFDVASMSEYTFRGIPAAEGVDIQAKAAIAYIGDLEMELIEPLRGASTHMDYLKTRGQGVNHLSFGIVDDYDGIESSLQNSGIEIEGTAILGGAERYTYMATQEDLGTLFEFAKAYPGAENTLAPYATYPPQEG